MPTRRPKKQAKRITSNLGPGVPPNRRKFGLRETHRIIVGGVEIRAIGRARLWFPKHDNSEVKVEKIAEKPLNLSEDVA